MKKRNVILHTAIASAVLVLSGVANAGTLTGSTTFAAELFGAGSSAVALRPTILTYTFSTPGGIVLNPGGSVNVYYRVANGATLAAGAPGAGLTAGTTVTGLGLTATQSAVSTNGTTFVITLTNGTPGNVTIGVGSTLTWTAAAGAVITGTSAGSVTVQSSASVLAANLNAAALPADVDGGVSNVLSWTNTAEAITSAMAASSAFPFNSFGFAETTRIDLTVVGAPGNGLTNAAPFPNANANNTTQVNLGAFRFTETAGVQAIADGSTDYSLAGRTTAGTFAGTVTGAFKTGATANVTADATCAAGPVLGAGTLNAGLTTFTFAAGTLPTAGTNYYVCMTVPATAGVIPVTTPTASFTFNKTAATDVADSVTGTLYNLQQNGATVVIRNYIPAAVTGYIQTVRLINTGAIAAQASVALMDDVTGTVGTAVAVGTPIAAGGSLRLSQTQIETALGAPLSASVRPRLRFTAPTSAMEGQSFFNNANGAYTNLSGAE